MLEFLGGLALFGSAWLFVIACAVGLIVLWIAEENESGIAATLSVAVFLVIMHFGSNMNWLDWLTSHWWYALYYIGIGIVWSMFRFYLWGRDIGRSDAEGIARRKESFRDDKLREFRNEKSYQKMNDARNAEFDEWFGSQIDDSADSYSNRSVSASEKRDRGLRWIFHWPFSMSWWILKDFMKKLGRFIYRQFEGIFNAIFNAGRAQTSGVK